MSEEKTNKFSLSKITKSKKTSLFAGVGFLVILAGIAVYIATNQNKEVTSKNADSTVIFSVDGQDYLKDDILRLVQYPVTIEHRSEEESVRAVFDMYRDIAVGKKLGVNPTTEEINKQKDQIVTEDLKKLDGFQDKYAGWFDLAAQDNAVKGYVNPGYTAGYKGYAFVFYFGQHIEYGDDYKPAGLNDKTLIAQDKAYAKKRADFYHQQLKDGKLQPKDVNDQINSDSKIKNKFLTVNNPFGYDEKQQWPDQIGYGAVSNFVGLQRNTGLSDVQTGQEFPGPKMGQDTDKVPVYYYFTYLDAVPQSFSVTQAQFDESLQSLKTSYNYQSGIMAQNDPLSQEDASKLPPARTKEGTN